MNQLQMFSQILHFKYAAEDIPNFDGEIAFEDWYDLLVRVSDVIPVESGDSETTVSGTLKQLAALGCKTWKDDLQKDQCLDGLVGCFASSGGMKQTNRDKQRL